MVLWCYRHRRSFPLNHTQCTVVGAQQHVDVDPEFSLESSAPRIALSSTPGFRCNSIVVIRAVLLEVILSVIPLDG